MSVCVFFYVLPEWTQLDMSRNIQWSSCYHGNWLVLKKDLEINQLKSWVNCKGSGGKADQSLRKQNTHQTKCVLNIKHLHVLPTGLESTGIEGKGIHLISTPDWAKTNTWLDGSEVQETYFSWVWTCSVFKLLLITVYFKCGVK